MFIFREVIINRLPGKCFPSYFQSYWNGLIQKQPSRGFLKKACSENMQQIYKRTPIPKCDFNKVAKQIYWNRTSAWVFFCKFAAYFLLKKSLNFFKKESLAQVFSCEFCGISKNSYLRRTSRVAASQSKSIGIQVFGMVICWWINTKWSICNVNKYFGVVAVFNLLMLQ